MSNLKNKLQNFKKRKEQITCLTCYDSSFSKILNDSKIDIVLVGDSLGMVIKGKENTHSVTMDEILYHSKCVSTYKENFILMADMPINSYDNIDIATLNAKKLLEQEVDIVKVEYQDKHFEVIKGFVNAKIPICAHIGYLPQKSKNEEDIRIYGKDKKEKEKLLKQAKLLESIGVDIILLECVDSELANTITRSIITPVVGIGSGEGCDGQVQVLYDLIGVSKNPPKFSKNYLVNGNNIPEAIRNFYNYVKGINRK